MMIALMVVLIVCIAWPGGADSTQGSADANDNNNQNAGLTANTLDGPPAPVLPNTNNTHERTHANATPNPTTDANRSTIQAGLGSVIGNTHRRTPGNNTIQAPPLEQPLNIRATTDDSSNAQNTKAPAPVLIDPTPDQRPSVALNKGIEGIKEILASVRAYSSVTPGEVGAMLKQGMDLIGDGQYIEGRRVLSKLLWLRGSALDHRDADTVRRTLESVNKSLVFSDRTLHDDPHAEIYVVQDREYLSTIGRRYHITYQLIEQINNVKATRIRVGQKLKVIRGPFHAVVTKSAYRMDLYLQEKDGSMTYVRSFPVGVGKDDSTPIGTWVCKPGGKLENPSWTHPHTNRHYKRDDPNNPIGEHWIALRGTDANTKGLTGYGIHGTVEPESIGKQASLGCIRMLKNDVALVYKLLVDGKSTVHIQP